MRKAIDIINWKMIECVFQKSLSLRVSFCRLLSSNWKYWKQMCLLLLLATLCSGCTSAYWKDRGRDTLDMISFGYGVGYGVKAKAWLPVGFMIDFPHAGLRGGEFVQSDLPYSVVLRGNIDRMARRSMDAEYHFLVVGAARFNSTTLGRGKNYRYYYFGAEAKVDDEEDHISASEYTNIEVCVGLGPSVRFGINPGEILDFLLGWFTIDIYDDDIGAIGEAPPDD